MRTWLFSGLALASFALPAVAQDTRTDCTWIGPPVNQMQCRSKTDASPQPSIPYDPNAMMKGMQAGAAMRAHRDGELSPAAKRSLNKALETGDCAKAVRIALVESGVELAQGVEHYCPLLKEPTKQ